MATVSTMPLSADLMIENGRLVERVDEALNEPLFQPQQVSGGNGIFKPRQRGLTCQIGIVRQTVRDHFEDGVTA